eukprot:scaffold4216_cov389-Prasinococcus_capsulatus_cf.AAC.4
MSTRQQTTLSALKWHQSYMGRRVCRPRGRAGCTNRSSNCHRCGLWPHVGSGSGTGATCSRRTRTSLVPTLGACTTMSSGNMSYAHQVCGATSYPSVRGIGATALSPWRCLWCYVKACSNGANPPTS